MTMTEWKGQWEKGGKRLLFVVVFFHHQDYTQDNTNLLINRWFGWTQIEMGAMVFMVGLG